MITYIATNKVNGKFYIGSTTNLDKRKGEHLNSKLNHPFQNSLRNNPDSFVWHLAEDQLADPRFEQVLLDLYFGTELCYNLNPRADRPPSQTGRLVSEETRKKQSKARKGLKRSAETKRKISAALSGKNNPMFGKTGSANPSFNVRGDKHPSSKKVEVTYPDGAVRVFPSTSDAGKELGVHPVNVADAARKNRTKTKGKHTGYSFRYLPS